MNAHKTDDRPSWARGTLRPACPACGNYLMPCTATANGIHPDPAKDNLK